MGSLAHLLKYFSYNIAMYIFCVLEKSVLVLDHKFSRYGVRFGAF